MVELAACVGSGRAIETGERQRLARRNRQHLRLGAGTFQRISSHRNKRGEGGGVHPLRRDVIGYPATPTGGAVALRDGALPLLLLIRVRKQICRNGRLRRLIQRASQWLDQRTDVGDHRQLLTGKHAGDFLENREECVRRSRRALDPSQGGAGNDEGAACGQIRLVTGVIHGDDGVIRVVAAVKENADQSAIVRSRLGKRGDLGEARQCQRSQRSRSNANEISS